MIFNLLNYWGFRLGYHAALDDRERTGLTPITEETKEKCAQRAWCRLTGKRVPRKSGLY